jgi:CubicO group peptidase (beta-lactamase class C family)
MLAGHGELDGVRILSPERVEIVRALQTDDLDIVGGTRSRRAMGYSLGGVIDGVPNAMGTSGKEFGHGGNGGSLGFADPERRFAFGLTKNLLKAAPDPTKATAFVVADLIRKQLP